MAFPLSPTNGQIYKKYIYDSSSSSWNNLGLIANSSRELTMNTTMTIGTDQVYRQAFFKFNSSAALTNQYVHMKTNASKTAANIMNTFHYIGYNYGETKTIDALYCCYICTPYLTAPYSPCASGTHTCSGYYSSDGYLVLTLYVTFTDRMGFIVDQIGAGPQGLIPITITAYSLSSSATGAY